eukprot:9467176-Lingulodinium_polyedra.AAC.1
MAEAHGPCRTESLVDGDPSVRLDEGPRNAHGRFHGANWTPLEGGTGQSGPNMPLSPPGVCGGLGVLEASPS